MSKDYNKNSECDQKYVKSIMKSEADIAKCLKDILCDFKDNINQVEPIDKRSILIEKVVCAYSCKEDAMAKLIEALALKTDSNRPICEKHQHKKHRNNDKTIIVIFIIILLLINNRCCNRSYCYSY